MTQQKNDHPSHTQNSSIEFSGTIRALSHKGLGVVDHPDGRVFFVRGTWPGDAGTFRAPATAQSYDVVELVELSQKFAGRVEAPCPHRGACGGCPWMMVSYEEQVKAKEQRVTFLLEKNGITPAQRHPLIPSPSIWGYRNRAQFKTDGARIGYVTEGTNNLAPIDDCLILNPPMRTLLKDLKGTLPNSAWAPTGQHPWSYLDVDDQQTLDTVVLNRRRPFRQGNSAQNEAMKAWIISALEGKRRDLPVLEAFCGSGNFTEALSRAGFTNILAAEVRGSAIEELTARALPGVRIMEIDMNEKGVWQQLARRQPHAKILLVDPPREGIEKRRGLYKYLDNLETILYVSCEPTTWARDVKDFQQNGWRVAQVTPLDMFPHTPHVELLSVLVRA